MEATEGLSAELLADYPFDADRVVDEIARTWNRVTRIKRHGLPCDCYSLADGSKIYVYLAPESWKHRSPWASRP